jgi:hypothetical protein
MRYQVGFAQCIAPLAIGLLGLWLYRGRKDRARMILGGLLLGALGLWYGQLTLLLQDWGSGRLEKLAGEVLVQAGDGSPLWGAALGAQKARVNMLISAAVILVMLIVALGMGAGRGGLVMAHPPKGYWGNVARIALFAVLCAPLAGAVLGFAVVAGQDVQTAVVGVSVGLPVAMGGLVAAWGALTAVRVPLPAPAEGVGEGTGAGQG